MTNPSYVNNNLCHCLKSVLYMHMVKFICLALVGEAFSLTRVHLSNIYILLNN